MPDGIQQRVHTHERTVTTEERGAVTIWNASCSCGWATRGWNEERWARQSWSDHVRESGDPVSSGYRVTLMLMVYGDDIAATSLWRTVDLSLAPHGGMRLSGDDWNATIQHVEHTWKDDGEVVLYGVCEPLRFATKQRLEELYSEGWGGPSDA